MSDAEDRCSMRSAEIDEPIEGSAPRARAWLVLEQPGPYGFSALATSHLPDPVKSALAETSTTSGTTILLSRAAGHHADDRVRADRDPRQRRFWFAHTAPGGVKMRSGVIDDDDLLRPDLDDVLTAASRGELPPWGSRDDDPLLLVCTNGRRDICCAVNGRPIVEALVADSSVSSRVLEVSHLGGHRFAPTAVLLPTGHAFGRLTADAAREVLGRAREGSLGALDHHRGRTALAQPAQVAENAVRRAEGIDDLDALDALRRIEGRVAPASLRWEGDDGLAEVEVRHRDGRAWQVLTRRTPLSAARPESCGKSAAISQVWIADAPESIARWS
ncbi:MAG: sucrase ferredoxin [Actinobacteria bacterium]|nr:sucrase ferredoxin [Actinomycetota bacterium]MSX39152.1 sucrase ferredoxin [Actinomycetota bacterium]